MSISLVILPRTKKPATALVFLRQVNTLAAIDLLIRTYRANHLGSMIGAMQQAQASILKS